VKESEAAGFAVELKAMALAYYPSRQLEDETILFYFDDLREYSLREVGAAMRQHVRTPGRCRWFPLPGDLIEIMTSERSKAATSEWVGVEHLIRTSGRYTEPCIADARTQAAICALGGWQLLCSAESERDLAGLRERFVAAFGEAGAAQRQSLPAGQGSALIG
jgi:hypothetical protein